MMPIQCAGCAHLNTDGSFPIKCKAFPEGIPESILVDDVDHDRPMPELGQKNDLIWTEWIPGEEKRN